MDTTDNNGSHLPARLPSTSSHLPAMNAPNRTSYDLAPAAPTIQISPQGILRGLTRNWWRILALWAVVTAPLLYVIFLSFGPTYEASSTIRVEPTQLNLYGSLASGTQTQPLERYIETQKTQILANGLLEKAIALVSNSEFFKNSNDKVTDLKQKLNVQTQDKAAVIRVSFESKDPKEAADIVNAVVGQYMATYADMNLGRDNAKLVRLKNYLDKLETDKKRKHAELKKWVDKGNLVGSSVFNRDGDSRDGDSEHEGKAGEEESRPKSDDGKPKRPSGIDKISIEQYRQFKADILRKELEADDLAYTLEKRLTEAPEQEAETSGQSQAFQKAQRDARIVEMFRRDQSVGSLIADIAATDDELDHTKNVARKSIDPARRAAEKRKAQLTSQYNKLWEDRYDQLVQQVKREEEAAAAASVHAPANEAMPIEALKAKVEQSRRQLESLKSSVAKMDLEIATGESEVYAAEVLKADIETLTDQANRIREKYDDLEFTNQSGTSGVEVHLVESARAPVSPTSNKRVKFMILAPGAVLCLVIGLFVLLEVKAERVADPDSLSTRVQSEVYSLPPLPMVRASNRLAGPGEDDQIDRFIQRLDHLRFALCGDHPDVGLGRCVLITSAVGGEGKTTLAAQLAARCGHSGHSTLLIDADLRRGSLCPLLDVPEGLGLSDVLREEANAEDVVIPVQGGTFHLLCAGTPVSDTSRIFQGRNFGMLIARLRQSYDLIIIDSPPVLPVPDGLILGRWTDGAVLASRYDVSRAPQVERARRQLNNAGIPVLGTVINGMKTADSYYGRYSYSRGRSGSSDLNGSPES